MIIPKEIFDNIFDPGNVAYVGSSPLSNVWLKSKDSNDKTLNHDQSLIPLSGETTQLLHAISLKEGIPERMIIESMVTTYANVYGYTES